MLAPECASLTALWRSGTVRQAPTMAAPIAVLTGSGSTIMATPAAAIPLLSGLLNLLSNPRLLFLRFMSHPHLHAHPVIQLSSLAGRTRIAAVGPLPSGRDVTVALHNRWVHR